MKYPRPVLSVIRPAMAAISGPYTGSTNAGDGEGRSQPPMVGDPSPVRPVPWVRPSGRLTGRRVGRPVRVDCAVPMPAGGDEPLALAIEVRRHVTELPAAPQRQRRVVQLPGGGTGRGPRRPAKRLT